MTDATQNNNSVPSLDGFDLLGLFRRPEVGAFAGLLIIFLFFSYFGWDRNFLSPLGAASWLNFASTVGIIAIPIGFLMIAGELDISVGAMVPAACLPRRQAACGCGSAPFLLVSRTPAARGCT